MNTNTAPTKGNLLAAQKSLSLAKTGHDLMDQKHGILVREMMALLDRATALRGCIGSTYQQAYSALREASITLGNCMSLAECSPVEQGLSIELRSVMGVPLPTVRLPDKGAELCYGLVGSNAAYDEAYIAFHRLKLMLVELAELENSIYRLAVAIKRAQSRANALKNIIIPELEESCHAISSVLEEREREEFSRLKVIKNGR